MARIEKEALDVLRVRNRPANSTHMSVYIYDVVDVHARLFFNQSRVAFLVQSCFWLLDQLNHLIGRVRSMETRYERPSLMNPVRLSSLKLSPCPSLLLHLIIYYT
jgi:hypothetical protein